MSSHPTGAGRSRFCPQCGVQLPDGAKFCAGCGHQLGASARAARVTPKRSISPVWILLGVTMVAVPLAIGVRMASQPSAAPPPAGGVASAPPSMTDLSSMTPRDAADRLYDRVMRAVSGGNMAEATNFLPMAINAYSLVDTLDADGVFHLSMLLRVAEDHERALSLAESALVDAPRHLLLLGEAAEAALGTADTVEARRYAAELLRLFDEETARSFPDYDYHRNIFPQLRQRAETIAGY